MLLCYLLTGKQPVEIPTGPPTIPPNTLNEVICICHQNPHVFPVQLVKLCYSLSHILV